ncbi:MAG TPA: alpha/beta hydrolase [Candidatus Binatia bacterium]|nr:alpha/beta hydrolase [Candidatus Binatia bacterium]
MKLVLLPGLDGTGILFEPLLAALPENLHPMVQSYPRDEPLSYEELLPSIQAQLPVGEPFIVLGESFSGPLALRVAVARPPGLKAIILCASFVRNPVRLFPSWCRPLIRSFLFSRYFLPVRALIGGYSGPDLLPLVKRAKVISPAVRAARARAIVGVNVEDALAACRVPILYIAGSQDRVVPKHNLARVKAINPGVKVVVLQAPHLVLQAAPEAAARAIAEFAASVASS